MIAPLPAWDTHFCAKAHLTVGPKGDVGDSNSECLGVYQNEMPVWLPSRELAAGSNTIVRT